MKKTTKKPEAFKDLLWRKYKWHIAISSLLFVVLFGIFLLSSKMSVQSQPIQPQVIVKTEKVYVEGDQTIQDLLEILPTTIIFFIPIAIAIVFFTQSLFKRRRWL